MSTAPWRHIVFTLYQQMCTVCDGKYTAILNDTTLSLGTRQSLRVGGRQSERFLAEDDGVIAEVTSGVCCNCQLAQTLAN